MRANNLTLLTDLYELTMMQGYFKNPTNQTVVFDMFYRDNPCGGGFAICASPLALSRQPSDWNKRRIKHHMLRHKCKSIPVAKVTGIFVCLKNLSFDIWG